MVNPYVFYFELKKNIIPKYYVKFYGADNRDRTDIFAMARRHNSHYTISAFLVVKLNLHNNYIKIALNSQAKYTEN